MCCDGERGVNVLLPYIYDERWNENLLLGSSYSHNCNILQQGKFNDWSLPIQKAKAVLEKSINARR